VHQKLAIVVLAAGLLFGATGCTPAMSTAETCDKMKTVVLGNLSMFGSGIDKARKTGMIDQLKPMEATESPELRAMVTDTIEYLQESVKDNPDSSKVSELSARANKSASAFTKICR
jgi:hypothetical protein